MIAFAEDVIESRIVILDRVVCFVDQSLRRWGDMPFTVGEAAALYRREVSSTASDSTFRRDLRSAVRQGWIAPVEFGTYRVELENLPFQERAAG